MRNAMAPGRRANRFWPTLIGLVALCSAALALGTSQRDTVAQAGADRIAELRRAAEEIGRGNFDGARDELQDATETLRESWAAQALETVLTEYEQLREHSRSAQLAAYDEAVDEVETAIEEAKWRQALLDHSRTFEFTSTTKSDEEKRLEDEACKRWLAALGQLRFSHELARRIEVDEQVDPGLRERLVEQCHEIAAELVAQGEYMQAYVQVYYHLEKLAKDNMQWKEAGERLVRQAMLVDMYAPDPNQEALPWQQRRDGVSFAVFSESLQRVLERYVEEPPLRKMADMGLRNCILLGETPRLGETFPSLADNEQRGKYLEQLRAIRNELGGLPIENLSYSYLLGLLRSVQQVNRDTLDLPDEVVIAEFGEGVFGALDGYTYVVWPGEVRSFRKDMTGEFSGIGVEIGKENGLLRINSLLEGGSAAEAGLDAGDIIVAVDGKPTSNMSLTMAVERITGQRGTTVTLTIDREGWDEPREFALERKKVVVHTVKGLYRDKGGDWQYLLDPDRKIGYVRLTNFYGETTESLKHALRNMDRQGLEGLVLDLRDNSGGYLGTAVEVVDLFLRSGVIVSTAGRAGGDVSYDWARGEGTFDAQMPLMILINQNSASASEIVAGALQDHGRAVVVGSRSYGKGNVQVIQPLRPSDAELKMTIAYYYLPSGRKVHRQPDADEAAQYGVTPTARLELTAEETKTMAEAWREAGVLHQNAGADGRAVYTPERLREADPQLHLAWLCLRGDLLARQLEKDGSNVQWVGPVTGIRTADRQAANQ